MITESPQQIHDAETVCQRCGIIDNRHTAPGTGPHGAKLVCARCGSFLKWLPKSAPEEREAKRKAAIQKVMATRPPTEHQLRYLKKLAYKGQKPSNRFEASQKISALRKARGWV